jgi:hypothetical protein
MGGALSAAARELGGERVARSSDGKEQQMGTSAATHEVAPDRRESEPKRASEPKPGRERPAPGSKHEEQPVVRRSAKRRRSSKDNGGAGAIRYFLTKSSSGTPELDQEVPDEHQALITALIQDRHFVTVKEWRAKVDIKKGAPVIEKDPVVRE